MKLPKIHPPTAAVLCVTIASLAAVYVLVPEHRAEIAVAVGAAGSVALGLMRALLAPAPASSERREPTHIPPRPRRERETDAPPPGDA